MKLAYLLTSHCNISVTKGKFGNLKFSNEMSLGYPKALIISVKAARNLIYRIMYNKSFQSNRDYKYINC